MSSLRAPARCCCFCLDTGKTTRVCVQTLTVWYRAPDTSRRVARSPDLSPIELGFSVFKQHLQQIGLKGRSDQEFERVVFEALARWDVNAARNSFRRCYFQVESVQEEETRLGLTVVACALVVLLEEEEG